MRVLLLLFLDHAAAIEEWIDEGTTALCPRCGVDSVLPDNVPRAPLTVELLQEMHAYWFEDKGPA
jgi:hypothetical protein